MTAGPVTTQLVLAQCQKCQAYIFSGVVAGLNALMDPAPLAEAENVRDALIAGKSLYHVRMLGGKPQKAVNVLGTQVGESIKHGIPLWAQHGCAASGTVRASKVEAPPEDPQQAPATPGRGRGGFHRPTALAGGSQGRTAKIAIEDVRSYFTHPSVARNATPRPSRCQLCRKLITGNEANVIAIEYGGRIVWGYHVDH